MSLCRLCLLKVEINGSQVVTGTELFLKIKECVTIEIKPEDPYTKLVCLSCVEKINSWFIFKSQCLNSSKILNESLVFNEVSKQSNRNICSNPSDDDNSNEQWVQVREDSPVEPCHVNAVQEVYSCDFCDSRFEFYTDFLDHQEKHSKSEFHCDKCTEVFYSREELLHHESNHKISCKYCGLMVQKQSMKGHLNKHSDKYKCPQCSQRFNCRSNLQNHITSLHTKVKNYFCDVCAKVFSTKGSLKIHLKVHSDEKKYKCKECDYAGRTSAGLYIHMATHANEVHVCEYCSKIFKSNRNLSDHLKRVHCEVKNHRCSYCGKEFYLRYMLQVHLRTHTGVHPYQCTKCSRTFARSDSLKKHMNTHDRSSYFDCSKCSKRFLTKKGFRQHNCAIISP